MKYIKEYYKENKRITEEITREKAVKAVGESKLFEFEVKAKTVHIPHIPFVMRIEGANYCIGTES